MLKKLIHIITCIISRRLKYVKISTRVVDSSTLEIRGYSFTSMPVNSVVLTTNHVNFGLAAIGYPSFLKRLMLKTLGVYKAGFMHKLNIDQISIASTDHFNVSALAHDDIEIWNRSYLIPIHIPDVEKKTVNIDKIEEEIFSDTHRKKILVLNDFTTTPTEDSGSLRLYKILEILSESYNVLFYATRDSERNLKFKKLPANISSIRNDEDFKELLVHFGSEIDYIWVCRPDVAKKCFSMLIEYAIQARLIYDCVDLHWLRYKRQFQISGELIDQEQYEYYLHLEKSIFEIVDHVIAITDDEAELVRNEFPVIQVDTIPNIHDKSNSVSSWRDRRNFLFLGGFEHYPNVDAVHYLAKDLCPKLSEELEGVDIIVVGSRIPENLLELQRDNLHFLGYVEDLNPVFNSVMGMIAPLRFGAGMKGKIGQSMSYGVPVITSHIGSEGMGLINNENVLLAENVEGYISSMKLLLHNEEVWNMLSRNSIEHIDKNFTSDKIRLKLLNVLADQK